MKLRSKALKFADWADAIKRIHQNKKPKRFTNKDGSITTKPIVLVDTTKSEAQIKQECLEWLRKNGCIADSMSIGVGQLGESGYKTYGIIGAGDIIGILPNGLHFEIETKAGKGGRWSVLQQRRAAKIKRNNAIYLIVHGIEELKYYMENYLC